MKRLIAVAALAALTVPGCAEANNDDVVNWGAKLGAKFVF